MFINTGRLFLFDCLVESTSFMKIVLTVLCVENMQTLVLFMTIYSSTAHIVIFER